MILNSKYCITPGNCIPIETEVPDWVVLLLIGSTIFLIKEVINSLN